MEDVVTEGVKHKPDPASPVAGTTTGKKAYKAPALLAWGTLRDLTLSAGKSSSVNDGGSKFGNKQTS